MRNRILLNTSVLFTGLVFLISGVAKGINIDGFGDILRDFGFDWFYFLAPFISALELFIGFGLVFFVSPKKFGFLSLVITLFFTFILAIADVMLDIQDCGCMGSMVTIPMYLSYIRNALLICLSFYIWKYYPEHGNAKWLRLRFILTAAFAMISLTISALDIVSAHEREQMILRVNVNTTFLPEVVKLPDADRYLIFSFLPTCSHCQKAVEQLNELRRAGLAGDIVGIYPSYTNVKDLANFVSQFNVEFPVYPLSYDSIRLLTGSESYPTILLVANDTIVSKFKSTVPDAEDLQ